MKKSLGITIICLMVIGEMTAIKKVKFFKKVIWTVFEKNSNKHTSNGQGSKNDQGQDAKDPCQPTPCGVNARCEVIQGVAKCSCLPNYVGEPPKCHLECVNSDDCPLNKACINGRCDDPCIDKCRSNEKCRIVRNGPVCNCLDGYVRNSTKHCVLDPCYGKPCRLNSRCQVVNGVGKCICLPDVIFDPESDCFYKCIKDNDCPLDEACINGVCGDPCIYKCGINEECWSVINHIPDCYCPVGYMRNSTKHCVEDQCYGDQCSLNSHCQVVNGANQCICQPGFIYDPPGCRPKCVRDVNCSQNNETCAQQPCKCPSGYFSDEFDRCIRDLCQSPNSGHSCAYFSKCVPVDDFNTECQCLPGFYYSSNTRTCRIREKPE